MTTKRMPIGIDNFADLKINNFYYVDKTGMLGARKGREIKSNREAGNGIAFCKKLCRVLGE